MSEAEGVERGTKIVIHLKGDCYDYCKEELIRGKCSKNCHMETYKQAYMASQLAFYVNLHRAIIGPSATLTAR